MKLTLEEVLLFLCGLIVGILLMVGFFSTDGQWRNKSVELGHAEYYLDANHNRQWRWLTNCAHVAITNVTLVQDASGNYVLRFVGPPEKMIP